MLLSVDKKDSFGGLILESYRIEVPDHYWGNIPAISRLIKFRIGWSGLRADVVDYGEGRFQISPVGVHEVAFIHLTA
ncbi:MAG: hypothetical protein ACO3LE_10405 [Bdellovibrionota bacterium]